MAAPGRRLKVEERPAPLQVGITAALLPPVPQGELVAASKIKNRIEREREINRVTDRIKKNHPSFFQE